MKIIFDPDTLTDNVTACTASTEDAAFPDENLRDDFTTNLWKGASGTTATITLEVSKGSAVALINTNAISATVSATSGEVFAFETDWSAETDWSLVDDEVVASTVIYDLPGSHGRLWAEYSAFTSPHIVTISLTASGSVVTAGIVRAGDVIEFNDPAPLNREASMDFSIEKELNNGADYYRKRNVVRSFSNLSMLETRVNAWIFKHDIFDAIGPQPLAIKLFQNSTLTDWQFVLFAKRTDPPELEHISVNHSRIFFGLREVV